MADSLKRTILITGGSRGIGREIATKMAEDGHTVFVTSRSAEKLDDLKKRFPDSLHPIESDLSNQNEVNKVVDSVTANASSLDVLINNAGSLIIKPFKDTSDEDWYAQLGCNLMAPVRLIRSLLGIMKPGSHIVNIGSMGGFQGSSKFAGLAAYSVSKGGLSLLTECLSAEFVEQGVAVNCLCLGAVQTEMLNAAFPGLKAPVNPPEMADFINNFALNGQNFFNGKVLPVSLADPK